MKDKISIASDACVLLGADPIQAFDENTTEALAVRAMYDDVYENCLAYRNWTFATMVLPLVRIQKEPEYGFKYVYRLPQEVVNVINLNNTKASYRLIANREIHTDLEVIDVTALIKPKEQMLPNNFVMAMKFLLAAAMAPIITDDSSQAERYELKGARLLGQAADADAVQQPHSYLSRINSPLLAYHN